MHIFDLVRFSMHAAPHQIKDLQHVHELSKNMVIFGSLTNPVTREEDNEKIRSAKS